MPLRIEPGTLQKNTMLAIARNFDYICYNAKSREEMCQMIYDESYLQVEGPFKNLPPLINLGLMDMMREVGRLRRHHLHSLIQAHIIDFTISGVGETFLAIDLLMERCRRLRRLDLSYLRTVGPPILVRLIPSLTQVTVLNLSMTETVDQVLELIGRHCPEIRELDISNTPITEAGLIRLSYDAEKDRPMCQKLTKLSITGCVITAKPVSFLLQYIPTLREIDFDDIFEVFGVMKEWGLTLENIDDCEKYHLRILNSTNVYVDPDNIHIAITLCPYATNFTLSNAFVENEVLYKVMTMEYLTHLRITNSEGLTLNFQEGILPVLTVKGHQLISLLLANFTNVDVAAIGESCPRLQNLALSAIGVYEDIVYPREHHFTQLRNLEVWSSLTVESCNTIILRQLLCYSKNLRNLLVKCTDALSDKLLFDIWRENDMRHLSRLTIDTCPNVTASAIHHLLDMTNKLTLIRLWGCFFITKDDDIKFQKRIKQENCDLYLEWYCWDG
ncbi:F-box/LRR-repeat protein 20-like isoform X3 [Procambarus clarkii]|uniref:F-box/LRR-repeat protein 20 isoform X3 n=1 Tax=Procambarus clarkii TaxID=6728 RepID=UPI003742F932